MIVDLYVLNSRLTALLAQFVHRSGSFTLSSHVWWYLGKSFKDFKVEETRVIKWFWIYTYSSITIATCYGYEDETGSIDSAFLILLFAPSIKILKRSKKKCAPHSGRQYLHGIHIFSTSYLLKRPGWSTLRLNDSICHQHFTFEVIKSHGGRQCRYGT